MIRKRISKDSDAGTTAPPAILVIEDNPITRKLVQVTLRKEGYEVIAVADGKSALEEAARRMPALILLDLKLPDIDGIDLLGKLRALRGGEGIPILAFTGFVTKVEEGIVANAGFTDFLIKPVEPSQLVAAIRTYLLPADARSEKAGGGRRLLLVDDDPIQLKYSRLQFTNAGFNVTAVRSGRDALDRARKQPPDVIVSDVLMPGMDGFQLCYAVRRDPGLRGVPVVLISANYLEEADRGLAERIGASAYVYRGAGMKEMLEAVVRALSREAPAATLQNDEEFERERRARIVWQLDRLMNLRLGAQQRSYTQVAILNELSLISEALVQRRDASAALKGILAHCLDGAGLSRGVLYLADDQGRPQLLVQYGCDNLLGAAKNLFGQPELFATLLKAEYPVQLPSAAVPEQAGRALLAAMEAESVLIIPIPRTSGGRGLLALFSASRNLVDEDWVAFGRSLAAQIGQTIALSQAILKLVKSEQELRRYAEIVDTTTDMLAIRDTHNRYVVVNDEFCKYLGRARGQIIGHTPAEFFHPDQYDEIVRPSAERCLQGETVKVDAWIDYPGAGRRYVNLHYHPFRDAAGRVTGVLVAARDITDRKRQEDELNYINRALKAMSACNAVVVRSVNEHGFLSEFCRVLVEEVGFKMVWVGRAEQDAARTVRPVAQAGFEQGYLERVKITWADNELGRGPAGTAIRTGKPGVIQNVHTDPRFAPWREEAVKRGFAAVAALPLIVSGEIFGSLNLYAAEAESFDDREITLLGELANEFAHGIEFLHTRREQEKTQAALRESEALLRLFIEHAPAAIAMFDANMRYLAVSRRWMSDYNLGDQNLIGRSHYEVFPEIPQRWREVHQRCLAGASEICEEDRFERADGSAQWLRWEARPWRRGDGGIGGILIFTVDITERKHAAAGLRKLASVVEQTDDLVLITNAEGIIEYANPAFERRSGHPLVKLLGRKPNIVKSGLHDEAFFRRMWATILKGEPFREIFINRRRNGEIYYEQKTITPLRDESGKITHFVSTGKDVTEQRLAQEQLQLRLEQQNAVARLGQFALAVREPATIEAEAVAILAHTLHVEFSKVLKKIPGREALLLSAGVGWRKGLVGHAVMEIGQHTLAGFALRSKTPVLVEDVAREKRFKPPPLFTEHGIVSGASIIIGDPGNPLGILGVHSTRQRRFTDNDIHFLEAVANILAEGQLRYVQEQMLAQTEKRFAHLINSSPSVIYATTLAKPHRCTFVSETFKDVIGIEPAIMQNDLNFWPEHVHPEDLRTILPEIETLLRRGGGTVEYRFRRKDGGYCWIRDVFRVIDDEIVGSWTDVTSSREAERKIEESEERFRAIAAASNDIVYEWVPHGHQFTWYGEIGALLGYGAGEFDGTLAGWENSIHPDDRERVLLAVEAHLQNPDRPFSEEYRVRTKEGGYRYFTDHGLVIYGREGVPRWIGAVRDITDNKLLELQLAQAQKMEAVGQLTGGVAHDFNNRLTAIIGNLELLERRLEGDPTALRFVRAALTAAEGGADLTKNLLSFSRKQVLDTQAFNANDVVRGMHDLFHSTLGETIRVETTLAADLWTINTDRSLLENVLLNLVINARDAMPGGGTLTIETGNCVLDAKYVARHAHAKAGDYVLIAVSDTGAGMSEEVKRHAFEPFFTTKERGKGTGLGLSMAYGFVKQSSGHIELYSELGHGTSVKLYLPRHKLAAEKDSMAGAVATWKLGKLPGRKVLVVEDDAGVLAIARETLIDMECQVIAAENGPAALQCFAREPDIDILFTDVVMPGGMTGVELAQKLRERKPDLKVIYTSGYAPQAAANHISTTENDYWLAKPYRARALKLVVRRALGMEDEQ